MKAKARFLRGCHHAAAMHAGHKSLCRNVKPNPFIHRSCLRDHDRFRFAT